MISFIKNILLFFIPNSRKKDIVSKVDPTKSKARKSKKKLEDFNYTIF